MRYSSEAGRAAVAKVRAGERITLDEADALALDWLRYWQRRYSRPVRVEREYGICSGWYAGLMPRFVVRMLVQSGRWQISTFEVPSANGRRTLRTSTLHPVA